MQFKEKMQAVVAWIKSKKVYVGIVVVVCIVIFMLVGRGEQVVSETYTVKKETVSLQAKLTGRTKSGSQVALGFADNGRVDSVTVTEGDRVRKGALLASLELSDLYADLSEAQASVVIAQSQASGSAASLEKIINEQNTLVANAKKALLSDDLAAVAEDSSTDRTAPTISGNYRGEEGEYIIRIYTSGSKSGYSFEVSGIEENIIDNVTTEQAVPLGTKGLYIQFPEASGYGNTEWIVSIPNKRSSSYTKNYNAYLAAVSTRDRVITEAKNDLLESSSSNSLLAAKIDQAKAQVSAVRARIAKRMIVAPFDGIVASVNVEQGETARAESTITLISDTDYEVVAKVPELDIGKLTVGAEASILLDAYPGETFPGKVLSINPAETIVDGVPVYEAKILFSPLDPKVRSGMTATVIVGAASQSGVIAVPTRFLVSANGETLVSVITENGSEKRPVTLGLKGSEGMVEVISGLSEGDKIELPSKD
ncbi:MAG: efflux RND transporter periplasmic adaptor subunit [Candidatus Pacebacteria bacterium]|jgi:HlyD family secretion protein|nr:efflux RND transporter periplasmic adaptor subunit [Candidatus Paceibacterota bacterium]